WDWRFCGLLALSSVVNYTAGRLIAGETTENRKKLWLVLAVAINLSILALFKYLGWFLQSLSDFLFAVGLERDIPLFELILPVGISFFTFQGISYVADIYRGRIKAERSPFEVALYLSFFPQLVAGPIVRAHDFLPQLKRPPRLTRLLAATGLFLIVLGLFKKMVIANYLAAEIADPVFFDPAAYGSADLLLAAYAYSIQIYCDFSGYSDIAIGVAALLGYRFRGNFNQPYRANGLRDFWRRWHMSLSTWLRDYLYIPLGGNRGSALATSRNLILTMLLGGIWHGANWTFVLWGLLHGLGLVAERAMSGRLSLAPWIGIILTFHFVTFLWILFRSETIFAASDFIAGLVAFRPSEGLATTGTLFLLLLGLIGQFLPQTAGRRCALFLANSSLAFRVVTFSLALLIIQWIAPEEVAPFIYFQF
ncbi:MAG: MBOAT family O-acyltransferase, partial [Pseudomonadota bacterium]